VVKYLYSIHYIFAHIASLGVPARREAIDIRVSVRKAERAAGLGWMK